MNNSQTIVVKQTRVNSPHVLSSGIIDATLIGESDSVLTEQNLTKLPIGIRNPRGQVRVFLQIEHEYTDFLENDKGQITLVVKMVDNTSFYVSAIHDLDDGDSRIVKVSWMAFGYEEYEDVAATLTTITADSVLGHFMETFDAATDMGGGFTTVELSLTPVPDSTLIVWVDRVAAFYGEDFSIFGKVITLNSALAGTEDIVISYRSVL